MEIAPLICRLAAGERERAGYFALRRAIFCVEQRLFAGDDRDDLDARAFAIVCFADGADGPRLAGVVRIWEEAPGDWWGGRLGVAPEFRTLAAVGRRLVQTAVGTARAWGAWRFRATVQRPNVAFFRRLRWHSLEETLVLGQPHHLMEAELTAYAPVEQPRPARAAISLERDNAA
jgi:putative N-acetyltransferase (TIGR04045 family)